MSSLTRSWKLLLPLGVLAIAVAAIASTSLAASQAREVRVAIMTDCKGAFGFGYELDIGGAQAALAQYAGGKPKNKKKPSAGMTGIKVGSDERQDRRVRLRRRHCPHGAQGDAAPDGAVEGRCHDRPAVR